jgi:hypothetical protein
VSAGSVAALYDIHGNLPALDAVLAEAAADVVVAGHTHRQYDRTAGGRRLINAGSVGRVFPDADPDEVAQDYERASAKPVPEASLIAPADNPLGGAARAGSAG